MPGTEAGLDVSNPNISLARKITPRAALYPILSLQ